MQDFFECLALSLCIVRMSPARELTPRAAGPPGILFAWTTPDLDIPREFQCSHVDPVRETGTTRPVVFAPGAYCRSQRTTRCLSQNAHPENVASPRSARSFPLRRQAVSRFSSVAICKMPLTSRFLDALFLPTVSLHLALLASFHYPIYLFLDIYPILFIY